MGDYNTANLATIGQFRFWCQKVLPAVYDDSLSYYELLCKIVRKLNEMIATDNEQTQAIKIIVSQLEELQDKFQEFIDSGFDDYYKEEVDKWIADNLEYIYRFTVKQVYFGLNLEGYFVAYIPESWEDIVFDTGMDYTKDTYGRLILRWDVNNADETVDQEPEERS